MMNQRTLPATGLPSPHVCSWRPAYAPCRSRQQLTTVCRYDLRQSANNAKQRHTEHNRSISAAERVLTPEQLDAAKASIVYQRAYQLCGASKGQLSIQMCLFLFTEQPQLLQVSNQLLAARISSLGQVLGISVPDVAELLVRCGALLDVLPLRLNSTAESYSIALHLPQPQTLVMLASDINLLDTPPLRVKQQVELLAQIMGLVLPAAARMVAACPHLLKVEAPAVQIRWVNLQALLQLEPPRLRQLLLQEPRLLMPSSQNLTQNHTAICQGLGIDAETLNRWVLVAPMLLLISAQQLQKRFDALQDLLVGEVAALGVDQHHAAAAAASSSMLGSSSGSSSSSAQWVSVAHLSNHLIDYINKDPRVLLVSSTEVKPRLQVVYQELMCSWDYIIWLISHHPSYLVLEPGSLTAWTSDVRYLCQCSSHQAAQLAACPQVFLTMAPEEVLLALQQFSQTHHIPFIKTLDICTQCPLLLQQHPTATTAAMQQLALMVPDQGLCKRLMMTAPEILLLGPRLQPHFVAAAAVLSLSCTQFALMLTNQPSLWWVLVPRQYWQQQQQQQVGSIEQQQGTPPWIERQRRLVLESLLALKACDLRPVSTLVDVAIRQPALLTLGAPVLQQHVRILKFICSRCSYWQQQLTASLPAAQLGRVLLRAGTWRRRLMFLVDSDLSRRVSLFEVAAMKKRDFTNAFDEEFQLWRIDKMQQQQQWLQKQQQPAVAWRRVGDQLQLEQQETAVAEEQQQQQWQHNLQQTVAAAMLLDSDGSKAAAAADISRSNKRIFSDTASEATRAANGGEQQQQHIATLMQIDAEDDDSVDLDQDVEIYYNDEYDLQQTAHIRQQQQPLHSHSSNSSTEDINPTSSSSSNSAADFGSNDSYESDIDDVTEQYVDDMNDDDDGDDDDDDGNQQQQQQQLGRQLHPGGGIAWQEPLISKHDMAVLHVQQSGLELYGSWQGCLVRPRESLQEHMYAADKEQQQQQQQQA